MTNNCAKQILDFLARKAGYSNFIFYSTVDVQMNIKYIATVNDAGSLVPLFKGISFVMVSSLDDYAEVLENMLEDSREGYDIETINNTIFLPANYSLERLEIEMDLANGCK